MLWTEQLFHIKKPIIAMLHPDALKMLYFINFINTSQTGIRTHALCISADAAGQDVDDALIAGVKQAAPEVAVLCNTGCRPDTLARKLP